MAFKMCKELSEALRIIASNLPMVSDRSQEIHFRKGSEIIEEDEVTEIEGVPVNPEKMYRETFPVLIAANHYRRLKRAWMKNGKAGVQHYMREVEKAVEKSKLKEDAE